MIPYQTRAALLQMEPSLDMHWHRLLHYVMQHSDSEVCEEIDRQILKPKDIVWDRVRQTFEYKVTHSLGILKHSFSSERMRMLAAKLSQSLHWLKDIRDCIQIADYLENAVHQIDQIQVDDDLKLQREKMLMRRVFLQDAAKLIRELDIDPPEGVRKLTVSQIKSFMIEVFIKQQLLGYWFKPLLPRHSKLMSHPFIQNWLLKEQEIRHFDIVKTSEYLFIVAPTNLFEHNPYSIRRFLFEDVMDHNQQVYLNGSVLDMRHVQDETYSQHFKQQVQMMVTIQHQVHKDVITIVQELEDVVEQQLIPMLCQSLGMVGTHSDIVARQHLRKFELILMTELLQPLKDALRNHLSHIEEFEYLFMNVHRMLSELLAHYQEFKQQPALFFNHAVQLFEYKLLAFLKLLEKRKDEIFVPLGMHEWSVMQERADKPVKTLQESLSSHIQDIRELQNNVNRLKKDRNEAQGSLIKRLMTSDKMDKEIQQYALTMMQIRKHAYLDIVQLPKEFRKYSVFIEFESFSATSEMERHYAFPCGDNGLTRLPLLVKLPTQLEDFDLENLNSSLSQELGATPALG